MLRQGESELPTCTHLICNLIVFPVTVYFTLDKIFPASAVTSRCICLARVIDQKARLLKPAIMGRAAQDIWGSTVRRGFKGKTRARSHCRWRGQLIFTEGHGLEPLSPALCGYSGLILKVQFVYSQP